MAALSPRQLAVLALELLADARACWQLHAALGHVQCEPEARAAYQHELGEILARGGREAAVLQLAISLCTGPGDELPILLSNGGTIEAEAESGQRMLH
jgi:hypothetical protein